MFGSEGALSRASLGFAPVETTACQATPEGNKAVSGVAEFVTNELYVLIELLLALVVWLVAKINSYWEPAGRFGRTTLAETRSATPMHSATDNNANSATLLGEVLMDMNCTPT